MMADEQRAFGGIGGWGEVDMVLSTSSVVVLLDMQFLGEVGGPVGWGSREVSRAGPEGVDRGSRVGRAG